jgi:branched-chain amino acid transport system substrate-binding protein
MARFGSLGSLVVALWTLSVACTPAAPPAANNAPQQAKELVIGGSMAITGGFSDVGKEYQKTYEWYFNQLNAKGGLLGRPVKLVLYDDESDPKKAASLYDKLITVDKVDLLIGPYPTPILAAVIPIAEREHMLLVQAGTVASSLLQGHGNRYTFTAFTFLDRDYTRPWMEWIQTLPVEQRPRSLAIFTLNNPFTIGTQAGLVDLAQKNNLQVAVNEVYDGTTTNFTSLVQKAKAANVDAVALLSYYPDSVQIAKTMAELKLKPKTWYNAISSTVPTWTTDLKEIGESTVTPVQVWHTMKYKGVDQLLKLAHDEFNISYIPFHVGSAATVADVLTAGVQGCGKIDQDCIADWLRANPVDTASGPLKFDADGIPQYSAVLTQVQNGKLVAVYPKDFADAQMVYPAP